MADNQKIEETLEILKGRIEGQQRAIASIARALAAGDDAKLSSVRSAVYVGAVFARRAEGLSDVARTAAQHSMEEIVKILSEKTT